MTNEEYEFILQDRIAKIKAINEQYDLEHNGFQAHSGGLDSCVTSRLLDVALPNNKIPRIFVNTGVEHKLMRKFVEKEKERDKRIVIINSNVNLPKMLRKDGYPFKSKPFAHNYAIFQRKGEESKTYQAMLKSAKFGIPPILKYMFKDKEALPFKISELCCYRLKKEPSHKWALENNKKINITGLKAEEGGNRATIQCTIFSKDGDLEKFHPLLVVTDEWEQEFIKRENIELCELYKEPYNFKRTGCMGCPFARNIQDQLNTMYKLLPNEYKQCLHLWKPVYDEYIRIGYRLKYYPHEKGVQMNIFDFMEEEK